jgi:hypothetical protein
MQNFQNKIAKGSNNPNPFLGYGLVSNPKGISSRVKFNDSAKYNLNSRDQFDWNKTFGLNGSQPGTECRWGWRWNIENTCLELYPYIRINGAIHFDNSLVFSNVPLNQWLNLKIEIKGDQYVFTYNGQAKEIVTNLTGKYNGTCQFNALWFGGTSAAPQQLTVDYESFDAFVQYQLGNAKQTWTVEYFDADGHLATADGGGGESYPIIAKVGTPVVAMGDVKIIA